MESRPFLIFDGNRRIEAVSPGSGAVLGMPEGRLLGMPCREAFDCPACSGDACPLRQALGGDAVEGLLPSNRMGGALAVTASAIVGAGRLSAAVQLRPRAPEEAVFGASLERVLDGLRTMTASDMAALAFYDEATSEIRWQVTSGSRNPDAASAIRLRPGEGFAGRIILTALPLTTFRFPQDLTDHPDAYPIFQAEGLKAALGVPVPGDNGVVGVLMVASRADRDFTDQDVTTLTQMATSLGLAAQMMCLYGEAVRAERAKLAHEVHDGLSQNLFGLKLLLFDLQQQYQTASPLMKQGLTEVVRLLDSTLVDVRRFIADLRRTSQAQSGLVGAISDYLAHYYRLTRLQVEFAVRLPSGEDVACQDRNEVLRIIQEALMNVHRHAGAGRVWVELARVGSRYRITVDDDGQGFDPNAVAEGHYGLATMSERAVRLGGELVVASAVGRGTTVTLWLPA
ncbi:MAG: sensor histidine kinase [Symbiobacteriaceae bacterium]|jgi:signal transduction histidine kinase|nr:sensor histidine kinase [Symbiobacteriaceae bacterium]